MKDQPEKDESVLICAPYDPTSPTIKGTVKNHCADCGAAVWTAPSGMQLLRDKPDVRVLCWTCADKSIKDAERLGEEIEHRVVPAAISELIEFLDSANPEQKFH